MNNSQVFNFVDIYSGDGDELKYRATAPVTSFKLSEDMMVEQTSSVMCESIEAVSGDYAVLRNSNGVKIIMRIVSVETNEQRQSELIVATGADLVTLSHLFNVSMEGYYTLTDLVGILNDDVIKFANYAMANLPYVYTGYTPPVRFFSTEYGLYLHSEIIRRIMTNYGLKVELDLGDGMFTLAGDDGLTSINVKLSIPERPVVKINIKDTNLISDYNIKFSDSAFNMLMVVFEGVDADFTYRLKANGEVHQFYYEGDRFQPRLIGAGGNETPIGSLSDENRSWWEGNIYPNKPSVTSIPIVKLEGTEDIDFSATVIEANKLAYGELRQQYYNHEIELVCNYFNDKMDFSNLSDVFSYDIELTIDEKVVNTRITRYEYIGDNNIKLKLGNARTSLTDKLKLKGVL